MRQIVAIFVGIVSLIATPLAAQEFPELSGRVVDAADIIPADVEAQLTEKLEALETQSQRQLVVATIPDLQGYDEQTFTYQMGREWGIGDAERNDGIILMVAPNERRVRIEVGYGLEGIMTDAMSALIIQNAIIPRFKADDYPGGIVAGSDAIIQQTRPPRGSGAASRGQRWSTTRKRQRRWLRLPHLARLHILLLHPAYAARWPQAPTLWKRRG